MKRYSKKNDDFIIDNASFMSDKKIGLHIGRSELGIARRRERLGIFKEQGSESLDRFNSKNSKRLEAIGLLNYIQYGKYKETALQRLSELNVDSFGLIVKSSRAKIPLRIKAKAYTMYVNGMNTQEVATELNTSRQSVWRWIESFKQYSGKNKMTLHIMSKV